MLLECSKTFIICPRKLGVAFITIRNTSPVHTMSFQTRSSRKLHTKCQIWGTLSSQEMRHSAIRRDIHCCWSVSKPSLVEQGWWEELLTTSISLLWFTSCHFCQGSPSNCTQSTRLGVPSQNGKGGTVLQGETYIAA